jgi:hypothetical protein
VQQLLPRWHQVHLTAGPPTSAAAAALPALQQLQLLSLLKVLYYILT